jgi:hypothetical protein
MCGDIAVLLIPSPSGAAVWEVPARRSCAASGRYQCAPGLKQPLRCDFDKLDLAPGSFERAIMGKFHRAINLAIALALVTIGGAGLVYFYFIAENWSPWLATAAGMVGFAGLYWLWDEHINAGPRGTSGER